MKREHTGIKDTGHISIPDNIPFKEDLIFYAPLNHIGTGVFLYG